MGGSHGSGGAVSWQINSLFETRGALRGDALGGEVAGKSGAGGILIEVPSRGGGGNRQDGRDDQDRCKTHHQDKIGRLVKGSGILAIIQSRRTHYCRDQSLLQSPNSRLCTT